MVSTTANAAWRHLHDMLSIPPETQVSDQELIRSWRNGQHHAFEVLVVRHGPMVFRTCRRVLHNQHDAEDAFQATFLVLARKIHSLRDPGRISSWLYGVAYRVALKMREAARLRREKELAQAPRFDSDPVQDITLREAQAIFHEEINRLPEKLRAPFVLCQLEERSREEAARMLGCPLGTLKSQLERARERLRARLTRRGVCLSMGFSLLTLGEQTAEASTHGTSTLLSLARQATQNNVSPQISALANGVHSAFSLGGRQAVALMVTLIGLVGVSLGILSSRPARHQANPETPATVASKADQPAPRPEFDRHGDPLPEGAVQRLGTHRFRQTNWVFDVAVSPDGKMIASAGGAGVFVWDQEGKLIRQLKIAVVNVHSVAFSPDGQWLAAHAVDNEIWLYKVATWERIRRLQGHGDKAELTVGVSRLHFTPDSKRLLSRGSDRTFRVWDVATGKEIPELQRSVKGIWASRLSPDGNTLALGPGEPENERGLVVLQDLNTKKELRRWKAHNEPVAAIAYSADGKTILTSEGSYGKPCTIKLWDLHSGKLLKEFIGHTSGVFSLQFSRDGKTILSAARHPDYSCRLWDVATGKELHKMVEPYGGGFHAKFLADEKKLVSWGGSNALYLYEVATGKPIARYAGSEEGIVGTRFSPDGKVAITADGRRTLRFWSTTTGQLLRKLDDEGYDTTDLALTPDGRLLASTNSDGKARLWDPTQGKLLQRLDAHKGWAKTVALSTDGTLLATSGEDGMIRLWETRTGKLHKEWPAQSSIYRLAFSPDGKWLAIAAGAGERTLRLWEVSTAREIFPLQQVNRSGVTDLAFSHTGSVLVAVNMDDMVCLWETATGQVLRRWEQPGASKVAISPTGNLLAASSGSVVLWDLFNGKKVCEFSGHLSLVTSLSFSPDGSVLASGSRDTTVLLWDVRQYAQLSPVQLSEEQKKSLWPTLGSKDASEAYQAIWTLAQSGKDGLALLQAQLQPVKSVEKKVLQPLLDDLGSRQFTVREQATKKLAELGRSVEPELRRALKARLDLEVRRRIESVLEVLDKEAWLPWCRALEALTLMNSEEARSLLESLARGDPDSRYTQEAKLILSLTKR